MSQVPKQPQDHHQENRETEGNMECHGCAGLCTFVQARHQPADRNWMSSSATMIQWKTLAGASYSDCAAMISVDAFDSDQAISELGTHGPGQECTQYPLIIYRRVIGSDRRELANVGSNPPWADETNAVKEANRSSFTSFGHRSK